jgi:hypothetical protein
MTAHEIGVKDMTSQNFKKVNHQEVGFPMRVLQDFFYHLIKTINIV